MLTINIIYGFTAPKRYKFKKKNFFLKKSGVVNKLNKFNKLHHNYIFNNML